MDRFQGGLAEAGRVGNLSALERLAEVRRHIEERVEGALRNGADDAGQLAQPAADEVAPCLELAAHLLDAALVAVEGRQRRVLADAAWVARLLALHVAHRL